MPDAIQNKRLRKMLIAAACLISVQWGIIATLAFGVIIWGGK